MIESKVLQTGMDSSGFIPNLICEFVQVTAHGCPAPVRFYRFDPPCRRIHDRSGPFGEPYYEVIQYPKEVSPCQSS